MIRIAAKGRDAEIGYSLLRATLGLNIFMHGTSRLLAGPSSFANSLIPAFQHTVLPAGLLRPFGLALPWLEAISGLLVLLGLWTRLALVAGSLLIITLTFGSTLKQDFSAAGIQLTYAAVYALLLAFRQYNAFSIDGLIAGRAPQTS